MDQTIKKIWKFISHDIWHTSMEGMSKSKAIFIKNLRVLVLSVRGYIEDKIAIRASALTFFTLLSIVPIFAMVFAIAKGFGAKEIMQDQLRSSLEGQEEVFNYIVSFADKMLENTLIQRYLEHKKRTNANPQVKRLPFDNYHRSYPDHPVGKHEHFYYYAIK